MISFRYLIGIKSGIADVFSHNYVKIGVDPNDSLPLIFFIF